jgi:hypothetical protein
MQAKGASMVKLVVLIALISIDSIMVSANHETAMAQFGLDFN